MPTDSRETLPSVPLVALFGWLLPGGGYLLLGEIGRGVTICVSILFLFITGLLIAGVRVIEVPGYDAESGKPLMLKNTGQWVMEAQPLTEIRNKLWSVPQAMTGPVAIVAGAYSLHAASADPDHPGQQLGTITHSRINEIGSLYLSVAGLLNLMAIIDAAWRAAARAERAAGGQVTA
jgi:hypothetical protein